jgi:RNA polymerase subunit RPABC4/transcription elongation factor Spt4
MAHRGARCFHFDRESKPMERRCQSCGGWTPDGARYCNHCGAAMYPAARRADHAIALALAQPVGEFCELRCAGFFGHRWKAYGVLSGGRYLFNEEDRWCPRCGKLAVSAMAQADLMVREQRRTNFWLAMTYLFRNR